MKLDDNRPHLEITLQDKSGLDPLAMEANRDWASHEIVLELDPPGSGVFDTCNPMPGSATARLVTTKGAKYRVMEVRRMGPHFAPIIYRINQVGKSAGEPIEVADGGSVTIEIGGRARVSAWLDSPRMYNTDATDTDRIRPSVRSMSFAGLDDMTLLATIWLRDDTSDEVMFAENFIVPRDDDERRRYAQQLIAFFHKRRIQVFCGMYADTGNGQPSKTYGDRFVKWLRKKVAGQTGPLKPLFANHARVVTQFFSANGLEFDGISMDHEIAGDGNFLGLRASDRPAIEALYQAFADELAKTGRYLAYANNPFTYFDHETWMPHELGQYPNIIVRPMSYLGQNYRAKVMKYALAKPTGGAGLHPAQLQVGWATEMPRDSDPTTFAKECADSEKKYRVGVIQFGFNPTQAQVDGFAAYDRALNPDGPPPGTLGQPLQGPLNAERIAILDAASR